MTWWEMDKVAVASGLKAVGYCRNSADIGQENSCDIQEEKIRAFAAKNNIEIIEIYADRGKSGLNAEGRPAFQALMQRVPVDDSFPLILVYDVSRWGRFQDTDLSAHYESICRQHGKEVVFVMHGDFESGRENTLINQLRKNIDRYQAAEYSKVLSTKTKDGAIKVAQLGYRPGGAPPYGMRRVMLDEQKQRDRVLDPGQRKGLQNGRTILEPGDTAQVAVVNEIFRLFVEKDYSEKQIAGHLNNRGIPSPGGGFWTAGSIRKILGDEQYAGSVVYNKTSGPLKSKSRRNRRDEWIVTPDSYVPVLEDPSLFEKAQSRLLIRRRLFSAEEMQNILKSVFEKYGLLTASLLHADGSGLLEHRVRKHFGSIPEAFQSLHPGIIDAIKDSVFQEIAQDAKNGSTTKSVGKSGEN